MIVSDLEHVDQQAPMTPQLEQAIAFLRQKNVPALADGRVELDGDRVFAIIQRYETVKTNTPVFEYHRKYLDVQCIVSGEETIGWAPADTMTITEPYDEAKDICFGTAEPNTWTPVRLCAGQLAILRPDDGHAPKLATIAPSPVMKIVVKIAV